MWTLVVVEPEIGRERGGPTRRAAIRAAVGPLAEQRLDEALGFAVGLRAIWPREALAHRPPVTDRREDARAIGHGVIREEPPHADPAAAKPRERPLQKCGAVRRIIGGEHFRIGEARRVVDGDMQIFPAGLARPPAAVAMDAMADAHDAAQALQIEVQQVADVGPLIALHGDRRLEQRHGG